MQEIFGHTTLHPLGLTATLLLGLATLLAPRRFAVLPFIVMACFVSSAQRIVIGGADFNLLRILVLFGWARLLIRGELRTLHTTGLDRAVIAWTVSAFLIHLLREPTVATMVNKLGRSFDSMGMYFLFRLLIREWKDVDRVVYSMIIVSVPVAIAFLIEHTTGRNAFAIFGGVREITVVRDGRLRCQGAFSHPIVAGCFWAALMPLIAARWWRGGARRASAIAGVVASTMVVALTASSTPALATLAGVVGGGMFLARNQMKWVRWGLVAFVAGVPLITGNPVWHLIAKGGVVGGSTGWHRVRLIDAFVDHFGDWWLLGYSSTRGWGRMLFDVTNQYLREGVQGGLATLTLFCVMIGVAYHHVGVLWRGARGDPARLAFSWAFGVALFVHCVSFIGTSYFGQITVIWFMLLAMISSMRASERSTAAPTNERDAVDRRPHARRSHGNLGVPPSAAARKRA